MKRNSSAMESWDRRDENYAQRMMASVDDETVEWVQKKTRELLHLMTHYKCAMMEIETRFNLLNEEYTLEHGRTPINSIKTRLKTLPSIKEKMERRGLPLTPDSIRENLNDIARVRVIDERIADGYYYSKTVRLLRTLLENPELLELPLREAVEYK